MHIDIAPETERLVREEISSGHFQSVDELILSGVQAWRERNLPQAPTDQFQRSKVAAARIREIQQRSKPDPEGWTVQDYINYGRP